jgi:hypothetical protein
MGIGWGVMLSSTGDLEKMMIDPEQKHNSPLDEGAVVFDPQQTCHATESIYTCE